MSEPIKEQIIEAISTVLDGIAGFTGTIERNKDTSVDSWPSLVIYEGDETHDIVDQLTQRNTLDVTIEGQVTAEQAGEADKNYIKLWADVVKAIFADTTLGDLAIDIRPQSTTHDRFTSETETPVRGFALTVQVDYVTDPADPYTQAPI